MKKYFYRYFLLSVMIPSFILIKDNETPDKTFACSVPQSVNYAMPPEEDTVSPCSEDIRWRYQTINGVLYRRKYNYTTSTWIGMWEPV